MNKGSEGLDSMGALKALHHPDTRGVALLVDDCPSMRSFAKVVISRALPELRIIEAAHPVAAIEHLSREGVAKTLAFIWSDRDMPMMDGIQFGEILSGKAVQGHRLEAEHEEAIRGVPKLMMTGTYDPDLARRLVDDGLFHHVGEKGVGGLAAVLENIRMAIEAAATAKNQSRELED